MWGSLLNRPTKTTRERGVVYGMTDSRQGGAESTRLDLTKKLEQQDRTINYPNIKDIYFKALGNS